MGACGSLAGVAPGRDDPELGLVMSAPLSRFRMAIDLMMGTRTDRVPMVRRQAGLIATRGG
jgi:hypothetical protein